ncbi:MAG TPA: TonB-dependent receptor [Chitinophagales bacterium]|nr:TonB-dependent receptor [Chitinophagales bacterium]
MRRIVPLVIILFLTFKFGAAQKKIAISGMVKDAKTGEAMAGAVVYPISNPTDGVSVNAYGFYSLSLNPGRDTIVAQYIGYDKKIIVLNLFADTIININLGEETRKLQEVVIKADKGNENVTSAQMGAEKLDVKEIDHIPVILGEKDIMKVLELLPGVKSAGDGNSGFYVRGGGADQNLILLDEAPVYNPGHLLGFFSTFNSDAIKDVTLYKGGMPADFGGRLSSVVDVRMKEGNDQNYSVSGGIGLITSRLTVEGPIKKHKGSFIVSGRGAYAGLFAKLSKTPSVKNSTLYFYDVNLKANYAITDRDRIFVSGYFGRDVFSFNNRFELNWGNITATARWNHVYSDKVFSNTSFIFNNYNYQILVGEDTNQATIKSGVQDFSLKEDLQYYPNNKNTLHFGFNFIYHTFTPGQITAISSQNSLVKLNVQQERSLESAFYASNEQDICPFFKMIYGVRVSLFTALGPQTTYNSYASIAGESTTTTIPTDSSIYKAAQPIVTYWNIEPRLSMNFIINEHNSIKISFDRNTQYLHQLSNTTSTNPTDLWVPTSKIVKPEISDQVATGYFGNFLHGALQPSVEIYYKYLQNQIDYISGADLILNKYVESQLTFGNGWSYGIETLLKYDVWKFHGWAAYTWSRTQRKFPDIDNGVPFYAKQDRTHEISLVVMCDITKKWNVSAVWVFYTGNAVTFPAGSYSIGSSSYALYTERNGNRMPNYHRLDIGATVELKKHKRWEHNLNMSIYNVYGRRNAYAINFQQDPKDPSKNQAVELTLFRWVPSITYNFKFL